VAEERCDEKIILLLFLRERNSQRQTWGTGNSSCRSAGTSRNERVRNPSLTRLYRAPAELTDEDLFYPIRTQQQKRRTRVGFHSSEDETCKIDRVDRPWSPIMKNSTPVAKSLPSSPGLEGGKDLVKLTS